jgi:hypothetical protein
LYKTKTISVSSPSRFIRLPSNGSGNVGNGVINTKKGSNNSSINFTPLSSNSSSSAYAYSSSSVHNLINTTGYFSIFKNTPQDKDGNPEYRGGDDWEVGKNDNKISPGFGEAFREEVILRTAVNAGSILAGGNPCVTLPFYRDFIDGTKSDQEILIAANTRLSQEARNDDALKVKFDVNSNKVISQINNVLFQQITQNSQVDINDLQNVLKSNSWNIQDVTFEGGKLKVIIHGTQQQEIGLRGLSVDYNPVEKKVSWHGNFSYSLFDDFAFSKDDADKNNPTGWLVLNPAYKLQQYGIAKPYSIKLVVEEPIKSEFVLSGHPNTPSSNFSSSFGSGYNT